MFETVDLTKTFGANTAVARATIRIDRPAFVGIIGRSGGGRAAQGDPQRPGHGVRELEVVL